jgi:hypothetical protein
MQYDAAIMNLFRCGVALVLSIFTFSSLPAVAAFAPFLTRLNANQKRWPLTNTEGKTTTMLSPLTRIVVLSEEPAANRFPARVFVVTALDDSIQLGYLARSAVQKNKISPTSTEQWSAFLTDAQVELSLATIPSPSQADTPAFTQLVQILQQKINFLSTHRARLNEKKWVDFVAQVSQTLKINLADKPATLAHFHQLIFQSLNPKGSRGNLAARTVFVPLSVEWFQSDLKLAHYFDAEWIHGNFDMKLWGDSGEGLSRTPGQTAFAEMAARFVDLKNWLDTQDRARLYDPEYTWLQNFSAQNLSTVDRFIFVHDQTWNNGLQPQQWQDFIPVDQSFGTLTDPALLSVLIHEVNVNSVDPYFLPGDTHSPREDSTARWNRLAIEKSWTPPNNPNERAEEVSKIMGISPRLSTVVLGILLHELAQTH